MLYASRCYKDIKQRYVALGKIRKKDIAYGVHDIFRTSTEMHLFCCENNIVNYCTYCRLLELVPVCYILPFLLLVMIGIKHKFGSCVPTLLVFPSLTVRSVTHPPLQHNMLLCVDRT